MALDLEEHSGGWVERFQSEALRLHVALGDNLVGVHHIGSTAVPELLAKPIIDILGVVTSLEACDGASPHMEMLGYEIMGAYGIPGRRYFRKFDANRTRTHHLHVFAEGSDHIDRHLAFRDYLIAHDEAVESYAALKHKMAAIDDGDWDMYVLGKDRFVKETEAKALAWWTSRSR